MDIDILLLPSIAIAVCSLIQSIFGTGLLVYGTPAMLLLGYSFAEALVCVLPASLVISVAQTSHGWSRIRSFKRRFLLFVLVPLVLALGIALTSQEALNVKPFVAAMLLATAFLRCSRKLSDAVSTLLEKVSAVYLTLMGALHGLTNMGGALLTIYVNSLYKEKEDIRAHIAFGYVLFISVQLVVIFLLGELPRKVLIPGVTVFPIIALSVYLLVGQHLFRAASAYLYYHLMTALMASFGVLLIVLE